MEYGLIGEKLGHSYSVEVHRQIGDYDYVLREIPRSDLGAFMEGKGFKAINVTIPYKQDVIPYLDSIDEAAKAIGAVNTIVTGLEAGQWKLAIDVNNIAAGLTAIPVTFNTTQNFSVPAGGYQVYVKGEPATQVLVGDVNNDGELTIGDVSALIDVLLSGEAGSEAADVNEDGEVTIGDVSSLIDMLLSRQ